MHMKVFRDFLKFIVVKMHNESRKIQKIRKKIENICNISADPKQSLDARHWKLFCLVKKLIGFDRLQHWIDIEMFLLDQPNAKREEVLDEIIECMKQDLIEHIVKG